MADAGEQAAGLLGREVGEVGEGLLERAQGVEGDRDGLAVELGRFVGAAEAVEVEGAARLGAGAGEAVAAEGLHADHGTDDVAVDVEIAGADAGQVLGHLLVDAGVQAVGQAVAGGVDGLDHLRQVGFPVAQDVEDGAEHLALQLGEVADLEHGRGDEGAGQRRRAAASGGATSPCA